MKNGKHNFSSFWLLSTSQTRKTCNQFTNGLIKHDCTFDFSNPCYDNGKHYKCNHFGCNIVSIKNEDGTWC